MSEYKKSYGVCSRAALFVLCPIMAVSAANASPLVFRGQNTAFFPEANPNSTAALMNSVEKPAAEAREVTPVDQNRLIIQGLNSRLTARIYDEIFGSVAGGGDTYTLPGGGSITYTNDGLNITIVIIDASGIRSEIVVPV